MSSAAENLSSLMQCLALANISDTEPANGNGAKFLQVIKDAGIKDMNDFVGFVDAAKYSEEWGQFCTFKVDGSPADTPAVLDRVLWARVKNAWNCMVDSKNAQKDASLAAKEEPLDCALSAAQCNTLADAWTARHNLVLDPNLRPADALIARLYREMQRKVPSLIDVRKVKALIHAAVPDITRKVQLDSRISVNIEDGDNEARQIQSVVSYYWGLRTLAYAYAFAGNELVQSMEEKGSTVINCPLNVNLDYADKALRLTTALDLPERAALSWMYARDVQTRSSMISYMRQGWPQGEALNKACREHSQEWTGGPKKQSDQELAHELLGKSIQEADSWGGRSNKRKRNDFMGSTASKWFKGDNSPCYAYNGTAGCNNKRCGKEHVCSFMRNGVMCGQNHSKAKFHSARPKGGKAKGKGDGKGSGGGKGKGKKGGR